MTTTQAFQQLKPCVSITGHRFAVAEPSGGNFGHAFTYCTRCGATRTELLNTRPGAKQ